MFSLLDRQPFDAHAGVYVLLCGNFGFSLLFIFKIFLHKILALTSLKSGCVCVCVCGEREPDVNVGKPRPASLYLSL